jgi:hypothetical protein
VFDLRFVFNRKQWLNKRWCYAYQNSPLAPKIEFAKTSNLYRIKKEITKLKRLSLKDVVYRLSGISRIGSDTTELSGPNAQPRSGPKNVFVDRKKNIKKDS